ncbi:MAG: FHA domain-containing protein, partial [Eubacteriales bacterium]|nr:FHA domain-containing protein [Eubacteriales bacterium]
MQALADIGIVLLRFVLAIYAIYIIYECFASMRRQKREEKPLIMLYNETIKQKIPILCWENLIGRGKGSDIVIQDPTVSRSHCVLLRRQEGWFISDIDSKGGTFVNGEEVEERRKLAVNDKIRIGSTTLVLHRGEEYDEEVKHSWFFSKASSRPSVPAVLLLMMVNLFHLFMAVEICFSFGEWHMDAFYIWGAVAVFSWVLYAFSRGVFGRLNFELETLAVFLTGTGCMLLVSQDMKDAYVQLIAAVGGAGLYMAILMFIKNPDRIVNWRLAVMIAAVVLLAINLVFGRVEFGAANRIYIAGISVQPSEIVKIAYIFVGASALDHLQTKRNFFEFLIFSAVCVGALAIMGDFGTALIFFATFIVISITRSGDYKTVILALVGAALACTLVVLFKPYIAQRFATWGHAL